MDKATKSISYGDQT